MFFFADFFKEKFMQDGPLLDINGVMGPYKWPEVNGFHWGYFNPIRGVMGPYLYITGEGAHFVVFKVEQTKYKQNPRPK